MTRDRQHREPGVDGDSIRHSPLAMDAATFRALGHRLVDQLADVLESLPHGPVTRDESPSAVRDALDLTGPLPESGMDPGPCWNGRRSCCSITRCSTATRASSGTSRRRRRRSGFSATFSPRR